MAKLSKTVEFEFEGVKQLQKKVKKAEKLFSQLKSVLAEIANSNVTMNVKQKN